MDDHSPRAGAFRLTAGFALTVAVGIAAVAAGLVTAGDLFAAIWGGVLLTLAAGPLRALTDSGQDPQGPPGPDAGPSADPSAGPDQSS